MPAHLAFMMAPNLLVKLNEKERARVTVRLSELRKLLKEENGGKISGEKR